MLIESLLAMLKYDQDFANYHSIEELSELPPTSHIFRTVSRLNKESFHSNNISSNHRKLHGVYFFRNAPAKENLEDVSPVVFITQAETIDEAREIHRSLWNSGTAPFIIVLLPNQIRIYTGFDYSGKNDRQGLLKEILIDDENLFGEIPFSISENLKQYTAEAIDYGDIWSEIQKSKQFNYENRVDKRLLKNLENLEEELLRKIRGIDYSEALKYIHALIGKYVYLRYLYDREILTESWAKDNGISLEDILGREAKLDKLLKLDALLEERFGGKVFPFPPNTKENLTNEIVSFTASIFKGDEISGQMSFLDYDFSYISVETLSFIYEQFLRAQKLDKKDGAVYTPKSLADYLINEIKTAKHLTVDMKVLDPCCGSGIFLVLTYQLLIEQKLREKNIGKLQPNELKEILENCIYGVERNSDACDVTRFSLILTLLNYVEPPDLDKNKDFHFPDLENTNIFKVDFFDESINYLPQFDWIIGNPPWKKISKSEQQEEKLVLSWLQKNQKTHPVGDKRTSEAFAWRATKFLAEDGYIGFILHAKSLFNHKSDQFRKSFFQQNEVRRITNFSNFQFILFPEAKVSAMTVVYKKSESNQKKKTIWHFSPFVANQLAAQLKKPFPPSPLWTITINADEIKLISPEEAEKGKVSTWKMAFWGDYDDEKAINRLRKVFTKTLGQIVKEKNWHLSQGLQLRDETKVTEQIEPLDASLFRKFGEEIFELDGQLLLDSNWKFQIPDKCLKQIHKEKQNIRKGRRNGEPLIKSPHLVVNPKYAIYSDKDFVVTGSQTGIATPSKDSEYLRAISIYLSSSVSRYLYFFVNPRWGIDRTADSPEDWRNLPVPSLTSEQIKLLADFQKELVSLEESLRKSKSTISDIEVELQKIVDSKIEDLLNIPNSLRVLIHDFLNVRLSLDRGRIASRKNLKVTAIEPATERQLVDYAEYLRNELDTFARGSETRHQVSIIRSTNFICCKVNIIASKEPLAVKVLKATTKKQIEELSSLKATLRQRFSQWVYVQREARYFDKELQVYYICKSPRYIEWTKSQAVSDSNDIIGEVLSTNNLINDGAVLIDEYDRSASRNL